MSSDQRPESARKAQAGRAYDHQYDSALLEAVQQGDSPRAQALLEQGANPNAALTYTDTVERGVPWGGHWMEEETRYHHVLSMAVNQGNAPLARLLLEYGARPDGQYYDVPITLAAAKGDIALVTLLLDFGAGPDQINSNPDSHSALTNAAQNGHLEIVRLLLERGANSTYKRSTLPFVKSLSPEGQRIAGPYFFNRTDERGISLMEAATHGYLEMVRLLLAYGADTLQESLALATVGGHQEVVDLLKQAGAKEGSS